MDKTRSKCALLLIDTMNEFDFPDGHKLLRQAIPLAKRLRRLKSRARELGWPVVYVNDNFTRWRSERSQIVARCMREGAAGKDVARLLLPDEEDYFILKPMHSAFYSTTLELLLRRLGTQTLMLAGLAGNICILHTAFDAHVREFKLIVPSDGSASNTPAEQRCALKIMKSVFKADVRPIRHWA